MNKHLNEDIDISATCFMSMLEIPHHTARIQHSFVQAWCICLNLAQLTNVYPHISSPCQHVTVLFHTCFIHAKGEFIFSHQASTPQMIDTPDRSPNNFLESASSQRSASGYQKQLWCNTKKIKLLMTSLPIHEPLSKSRNQKQIGIHVYIYI